MLDGVNIYAYVIGNPIRFVDLTGTELDVPSTQQPKFPVPQIGNNPQNFISDNPHARENWNRALEQVFHGGSPEKNLAKYQQELAKRVPGPQTKANTDRAYARDSFDSVRAKFFAWEARDPSFKYSSEQKENLKSGKAPDDDLQLDHMEKLARNLDRAIDPGNLIWSRGGPKGGLPKDSPHYERHYGSSGRRMEKFQSSHPPESSPRADPTAPYTTPKSVKPPMPALPPTQATPPRMPAMAGTPATPPKMPTNAGTPAALPAIPALPATPAAPPSMPALPPNVPTVSPFVQFVRQFVQHKSYSFEEIHGLPDGVLPPSFFFTPAPLPVGFPPFAPQPVPAWAP
jgi:hypothetical protein